MRPDPAIAPDLELRPAMRVVSHVTMVRRLEAGERLSYGRRRPLPEDRHRGHRPHRVCRRAAPAPPGTRRRGPDRRAEAPVRRHGHHGPDRGRPRRRPGRARRRGGAAGRAGRRPDHRRGMGDPAGHHQLRDRVPLRAEVAPDLPRRGAAGDARGVAHLRAGVEVGHWTDPSPAPESRSSPSPSRTWPRSRCAAARRGAARSPSSARDAGRDDPGPGLLRRVGVRAGLGRRCDAPSRGRRPGTSHAGRPGADRTRRCRLRPGGGRCHGEARARSRAPPHTTHAPPPRWRQGRSAPGRGLGGGVARARRRDATAGSARPPCRLPARTAGTVRAARAPWPPWWW